MDSFWPPGHLCQCLAGYLLEKRHPSGLELKTPVCDFQGGSSPLAAPLARSQNKWKIASKVGWGPRFELGPLGPCQGTKMSVSTVCLWLDDWLVLVRWKVDHRLQRVTLHLLHFGNLCQGHVPLLSWSTFLTNQWLWFALPAPMGTGHQPLAAGQCCRAGLRATVPLSLPPDLSWQRQVAVPASPDSNWGLG